MDKTTKVILILALIGLVLMLFTLGYGYFTQASHSTGHITFIASQIARHQIPLR